MTDKPTVTVTRKYIENLERQVENLKIFIEISTLISSTLDIKDLMPLVMEKAKGVMDAEACSIFFYNRETNKLECDVAMCEDESTSEIIRKMITLDMGQGIAGWVAANQEPIFIEDVTKDERFFKGADKLTGFTTKSIVAIPLIGRTGLIGVAEIINPKRKDYNSEIFQLLHRQFAISIENALSYRESIEKERMRQELEIASVLQKSFLPKSPIFRKAALLVSAVNISAAKVGGDIYDFIDIDDNRTGFFIGDVSGKGISAALYMAKVTSDLRYIASQEKAPEIVLKRLNSLLTGAPRGMFLTGIYGIVDASGDNISLSVAGHPPFLWFTDGEVRVMNIQAGPPLGIMPADYPVVNIALKKGDRLLLLTDGVFEAKDAGGRRIGFDNIVEFIKRSIGADGLLPKIVDHINAFSKGAKQADDLTMIEIQWNL